MAEHDLTHPLYLGNSHAVLTPQPASSPHNGRHKVRTPSFIQGGSSDPPPSSLSSLLQGVGQPLEKLKALHLGDLKLDDMLLLGLALLLLNEKSDKDILMVLAYLFLVGL